MHCLWKRDTGRLDQLFVMFKGNLSNFSAFLLLSLVSYSCQSQAAAVYTLWCTLLSLSDRFGFSMTLCEKRCLLYLRKPSTHPGPVIQWVCIFILGGGCLLLTTLLCSFSLTVSSQELLQPLSAVRVLLHTLPKFITLFSTHLPWIPTEGFAGCRCDSFVQELKSLWKWIF